MIQIQTKQGTDKAIQHSGSTLTSCVSPGGVIFILSYTFFTSSQFYQLPFLTLPIPEYATPRPGWKFTSPPTIATVDPASDSLGWGWFLCWEILFRRQIWSCCLEPTVTVVTGVIVRCKFLHPPPPPLINYHHLPLSFLTLVLYLYPILTNHNLSVIHPHAYSLKTLSDLTHRLGIFGPPGIVPWRYQYQWDHIPQSIGCHFHHTGNVDDEVACLIYIEFRGEDPRAPESLPIPPPW